MNASPLGKYAAPAAAVASLGIIGAAVFSLIFGAQLGVSASSQEQLNLLAAIAAGALFGSSVAVNGYKAPLDAHTLEITKLGVMGEANRAAIIAANPDAARTIAAVEAAASAKATIPVVPTS